MLSINALSLAPDVTAWLVNTRSPRILHVFDQACNLINERGNVLSVVTPQIGDGPFNLVIEGEICFSEHLYLHSLISNSPRRLDLGNLIINTGDAKLWNPRPDWRTLHARSVDIFNQLMSLSVYSSSIPNSLVSHLSNALVKADISSTKTITSQLAGLGIGLTPAGDDYLMGAIYAALIIHPIDVATSLASEIAETAAPLTTSLSAAWLKSAGRGEAGALWHELFDALLTGEGIELPMAKLLSVGETSGADALAGFLAMFSAYNERIIFNQCPS